MSKIVFFLFLLAVSVGQQSYAGVRDAILEQPQARSASLIALFSDFCLRGYPIPTLANQISCAGLSTATVKALDLDIQSIDRGDGKKEVFTIAFHQDLLAIAQDPKSLQVLDEINFDMTYATTEFQLNQSVYKILKDHRKTLRWVAVMLQDTSPKLAHLHYLKQKLNGNLLSQKIIAELETLIRKLMNFQQVNNSSVFSQSQLLPRSAQKFSRDLGWRIYHFYVPAYLANTMIAQGQNRSRAAFGAAMMNFSYEAITVNGGFRYPLGLQKYRPNPEKASDMYAGYIGACYGIGKPSCIQNSQEFKSLIAEDSLKTISVFRYAVLF